MSLAWLLLQFALCAVLIARAGYMLSVSADALAQAYGWGRGWVGLALLATVTSLPELACGISAVAVVGEPNLAVGNALGACVVNLLFLAVVDAMQRQQPLYQEASPTHLLSAGFGVVMLGFVALSLLTAREIPALLHVGVYSPGLLLLYLLALKAVHSHEHRDSAAIAHQTTEVVAGQPTTTAGSNAAGAWANRHREWRRFAAASLVVLAAGMWLPAVADRLAPALGLSASFVGTVLMAFVTTLPEIAVTLGALRLGALDMAIGNLLGSNLFNVAVLAVDDLFYMRGPLLSEVSTVHTGTAVTALVMSGLVIVGLVMRPKGQVLRVVSGVSVGLVATYAMNAAVVYLGHA